MTDTAELIADLVQRAVDALSSESQDDPHELIERLGARAEAAEARVAAQAQEIERQKASNQWSMQVIADVRERSEAAEARVRELGATINRYLADDFSCNGGAEVMFRSVLAKDPTAAPPAASESGDH